MGQVFVIFTKGNGGPVAINRDAVLFVQPYRGNESPLANSDIFVSSQDYIRVQENFKEVVHDLQNS